MTVLSTFIGQVKPGRLEDAVAMTAQAAKPLEAHGARNVRLFRAATGEAYGALAISCEFDSNEAWGAATDAFAADDEIVSLIARGDGEQSPYSSQSISTSTEIPIGGPKGRGPILQAIISRAAPGKMQAAIDLGTRTAELVGRHGASGCRLLWLGNAGTQAGLFVLIIEYATNAALGKGADAFFADPDGLALMGLVYGVDSPVTIISEDIYTEIAL